MDNCFVIEEYRYPIKKSVLQLPMGSIEDGEIPSKNAINELKEETGIVGEKVKELGKIYPLVGKSNIYTHVFLVENLNIDNLAINQEGNESILKIKKFSLSEVKEMIRNNKIESGETLAALNLLF